MMLGQFDYGSNENEEPIFLLSVFGEGGSSSSSSSSVESNSTTYGAQSPTVISCHSQVYSAPPQNSYVSHSHQLQGVQHYKWPNCPLSNESIYESMNRATPYSAQEKRERIQRYRNKRNLRNFNKKIKYECRKTLADSRPRVRGRFARNDDTDKATERQWDCPFVDEDDGDYYSWITILDALNKSSDALISSF